MLRHLIPAFILSLSSIIPVCSDAGSVAVTKPLIRMYAHNPDPKTPSSAAGYVILENTSDQPMELIDAAFASPDAAFASLIEVHDEKMQKQNSIRFEPGAKCAMKPGKNHLMFRGTSRQLKEGDTVPLTLTFQQGEKTFTQTVSFKVASNPEVQEAYKCTCGHGKGKEKGQEKQESADSKAVAA